MNRRNFLKLVGLCLTPTPVLAAAVNDIPEPEQKVTDFQLVEVHIVANPTDPQATFNAESMLQEGALSLDTTTNELYTYTNMNMDSEEIKEFREWVKLYER